MQISEFIYDAWVGVTYLELISCFILAVFVYVSFHVLLE